MEDDRDNSILSNESEDISIRASEEDIRRRKMMFKSSNLNKIRQAKIVQDIRSAKKMPTTAIRPTVIDKRKINELFSDVLRKSDTLLERARYEIICAQNVRNKQVSVINRIMNSRSSSIDASQNSLLTD
ncbi:hypothetical protein GJ496_010044 [Pomphorhynchus laevis]|nr:hypothetical protein GJ496_010044 [Pomphorhynchus laevis]